MAEASQYSLGTISTGDLLDEGPSSIELDSGTRLVDFPGRISDTSWFVSQGTKSYSPSASTFVAGRAVNIHRPHRKFESYQLPFSEDAPLYFDDPGELSVVHLNPFTASEKEMTEFKSQLVFDLESEAVEDGVVHTAEVAIQKALDMYPQDTPMWINGLFLEMLSEQKLSYASGLLQCLGRIKPDRIKSITKRLVTKGLSHESIELREAAITVIEQWGGEDMLEILHGHNDAVPWIAKYAQQVIQDLSQSR